MRSAVSYTVVLTALLTASWLVLGDQQIMELKTQDGSALCATDEPSLKATTSVRMRNAPGAVACGMTCTVDQHCRHFNYVEADPQHPCHLYYYRPTNFDRRPNCLHYHLPGV